MSTTNTLNIPETKDAADQDDGLKIIHAGLYRTGTASMSAAYRILGYKSHHALDSVWDVPWGQLEQAAEATFPHLAQLPGYTYKNGTRPPFTREDWQAIWGDYDVATDGASAFTMELIKAYPNAKVVVVQRRFESWWPSFKSELLHSLYDITWLQEWIATNILRLRAAHAMRKIHAGLFSTDEYSIESIEPRARDAYEDYYRKIREAAPSYRRLEYTLGDGWGPLCEFLGKEVPDVVFPRVNDRESHAMVTRRQRKEMWINSLKIVAPFVVVAVAVAVAYWRW
ncbi:efflux pump antibiotic resistance protein [Fusarium austroafricanum]|uniref:Efflux pump antibiotic resistance protein n=1 Tax=Fusarium austroafricanum TaxID=2364996 RepID=A0A8H4NM55_9HYPO|nr:efflux pump antibiotic resistance protein [Fusarium austroafricanum]